MTHGSVAPGPFTGKFKFKFRVSQLWNSNLRPGHWHIRVMPVITVFKFRDFKFAHELATVVQVGLALLSRYHLELSRVLLLLVSSYESLALRLPVA